MNRLRSTAVAWLLVALLVLPQTAPAAASKVKLRGYVTARVDAQTLGILGDRITFDANTQLVLQNAPSGESLREKDLVPGVLIEAEGYWVMKHRFSAAKITCDVNQFEKEIKESAYLQSEPEDAARIAGGNSAKLKVDGETLMLREATRREWKAPAEVKPASEKDPAGGARLVGHQVSYGGVRRSDGAISASRVELGATPPADAYKLPHGLQVVRGLDPETKIDILEFRRDKKVDGRLKLFPVPAVQEYVAQLGARLLPPAADVTAREIKFRFFVVEDPSINAQAMPDGTVLVNTGLLASVENEAQLAFVLSHEIAHVLQVHYWREVRETRPKRVLLTIGAIAGAYFIGDLALFLGELGMAATVSGYSRRIENQADRIGLQNMIDCGYDGRQAARFSELIIDRYGDRTTSKLWSDHDSSLLRGSFLFVQIQRQYPEAHFDKAVVNTPAFDAMREAMGPVKVM